MKAGWRVVPIGTTAKVDWGNTNLTKSAYVPDGPFLGVSAAGCDGRMNFAEHCKNTPVLSAIGAQCGRMFMPDEDFTAIKNTITLTPLGDRIDPFFLFYTLDFVDLPKRGAGQPFISKGDIEKFLIPLPPLDEQKRIVAILNEAFEGLSRARANAEANLADARELFGVVHKDALSQHAGGGRKVTMADVAEIASTLVDPRLPEYSSLPHVGAGNMPTCSDQLLDVQTAAEEGLTSGKFLIDQRMVLYSKIRPYLRKASRPDFDGLCSADVYPLMPKTGVLERDYLFYLLLGPHFTEYAIAGSARAGMPKVNREHLFKYSFELPDTDRQRDTAALLDQALSETRTLEADFTSKREAIDTLRQSLLQKAFSGELT